MVDQQHRPARSAVGRGARGLPSGDEDRTVAPADVRAGPDARTARRVAGDSAESGATGVLLAAGWQVLARNVRVGRTEVDIIALDPGVTLRAHGAVSTPTLVFVEVRSATRRRFGAPEESVDAPKVARLYRAALALVSTGRFPDGTPLPALPWRVDLLTMVRDDIGRPWRTGSHLRGLLPP
jgi:Holliday junction resolvase-like predicted endonuclease